jgi:hypothetical protein
MALWNSETSIPTRSSLLPASGGLANLQSPPKYQLSITRMIKPLPRLAHPSTGFSLTHQPGRTELFRWRKEPARPFAAGL